jgi:hypothetical protein
MYISYKEGCFYFGGREAYLGFYVGGVSHVPKILVMGPPQISPSDKIK